MTPIRHQMLAIARRDLLRERRSGEVLWITLPFGAIALVLIPLAVGTDAPMLARIGTGMYWVVVMLFGVLVAIRQTAGESRPQRDQLILGGADPAAVFAGRALASASLLLVFELVLGVVAFVLYDLDTAGLAVAPLAMLFVAAGLGMLGTVAASIASVGGATALVPLLVAPLSVPMLIGATQATEALRLGRSSLTWVLMMAVTALVLAVVGVLTARPLQESG